METNIFYRPNVGKEYPSGGIFGKRIMILGESHYCDEKCADCGLLSKHSKCAKFTEGVINDYLNEDKKRETWMNTFVKFERSLVGHTTNWEERHKIWQSVIFYNYLQSAVDGPRKGGSKVQYKNAQKGFYEVIDKYKPEAIIAWGSRLWNHLPGGSRWHWDKPIIIDDFKVLRGRYTLNNDESVKILKVYHPSGRYSWDWWFKAISEFLNIN